MAIILHGVRQKLIMKLVMLRKVHNLTGKKVKQKDMVGGQPTSGPTVHTIY